MLRGLKPDRDMVENMQQTNLHDVLKIKFPDGFPDAHFQKKIPIGIYRISPEGKIMNINQTLAELLGYSSAERLIGSSFEETIAFSQAARADFNMLLYLKKHIPDFISQWRKENGDLVLMRETAWVVLGEKGQVLFYEGAVNPVEQC